MARSASFVAVSLLGLLAGCQSERIVVVHEPAVAASPNGTSTDTTFASAPTTPVPIVTANGDDPEPPGEEPRQGAGTWGIVERDSGAEYAQVVQKVATMVTDHDLAMRVSRRKLSLVNVAWEDTGRSLGSSGGPNISDLTLQVRRRDDRERGGFAAALMPVIRPPNFIDRTGDIPADKFFVRVGNEASGALRSVPLTEVLSNLKTFTTSPESVRLATNLLAPRDSHFLVSAQAVFLPIPKDGKAEFNPVVFNYQSSPGFPAVMTILVTRQGTSIRVIENRGDRSVTGTGQEIYFNNKGQRASFTAERKSDVTARIEAKGGPSNDDEASALAKGADVLFLVQVPLMHERPRPVAPPSAPMGSMGGIGGSAGAPMKAAAPSPASAEASVARGAPQSDVEQAVLGHGPNLGPFREGFGTRLVRDPKFPIRVTVQFYKATSNGVVSDVDLDSIARSLGGVYEHADAVGSLVMPDGDPKRPTAWQNVPRQWFPW